MARADTAWLRRCWRSAAAPRSTPPRSSPRPQASTGSAHATPTPSTTAPPHCRFGPRTGHATGSTAPATDNSTPRSTGSLSCKPTGIPMPVSSSTAAASTAMAVSKPYGPSSDASPTSSTAPSTPSSPKKSAQPLDRGAIDRPHGRRELESRNSGHPRPPPMSRSTRSIVTTDLSARCSTKPSRSSTKSGRRSCLSARRTAARVR